MTRHPDSVDCPCGKTGHRSMRTAKAVLRSMRKKDGAANPPLRLYRCRERPEFWHTGHTLYRSTRPRRNQQESA